MREIPRLVVLSLLVGCSAESDPASVDAGGLVDAGDDELVLGVSSERYLDDLTAAEHEALCTWMVEIQGGPHSVECGGGVTITIDPVASCLELVWPHCQVGLLADCVAAQAVDLCASSPAECAAFYQCAGGG